MDSEPFPGIFNFVLINSLSLGTTFFSVVFLIFLLLMVAILAGSEVAFFSLNAEQRLNLRESENKAEIRVKKLLEKPQLLLATILVAINFVNILFIALANYFFSQIFGSEVHTAILTIILLFSITFIIAFFGELIPKVWAQQNNLRFAVATAPLIEFFGIIFLPLSKSLLGISAIFEKRIKKRSYVLTTEELNQALEITTNENTTEREKDILKGVLNFGNISVTGVMTPRNEIVAVEESETFHEVLDLINKNGYSRVPVYKETLDKVTGILYIKDLINSIEEEENFNWKQLIHSPLFVPETKKIDDLLHDFQEKRIHMALVVNEYGETEGLVTMEDIIEEIVGEINDEFDVEELDYKKISEGVYIFEAKIPLYDLVKIFDLDSNYFEDLKGESETLGGLLIELFSRIPVAGEEIRIKDFVFKVQSADNKKVKKVKAILQKTK